MSHPSDSTATLTRTTRPRGRGFWPTDDTMARLLRPKQPAPLAASPFPDYLGPVAVHPELGSKHPQHVGFSVVHNLADHVNSTNFVELSTRALGWGATDTELLLRLANLTLRDMARPNPLSAKVFEFGSTCISVGGLFYYPKYYFQISGVTAFWASGYLMYANMPANLADQIIRYVGQFQQFEARLRSGQPFAA